MKNKIFSKIFFCLVLFYGCNNNVAEQDDNDKDCSAVQQYYDDSISQIMAQSCTSCHSGVAPSGGLVLDTYSAVRNSISIVIDRVNRSEGSSGFMPQGSGRLSDADLDSLQAFFNMDCE